MKGKAAVVLVSLVVVIGAGALWWRTTAEVAPVSGAVPAPVRRLSGPLDRVRAAFDVSDRAARSARLEDVWRQLSPENAGQIADELWSRVQGSPFQNDWLEFLQRWAELDPAAAAQFIASHQGLRMGTV